MFFFRGQRLLHQQGFTVIEFIVVAALIAGALMLVLGQIGQGSVASRNELAVKNIGTLVRALNTGSRDPLSGFSGLSAAAMIASGELPEHMIDRSGATAVIRNVFGQAVTLAPNGTSTNSYAITYPGVDDQSCTEIAARLLYGFDEIGIAAAAATPAVWRSPQSVSGNPLATFAGDCAYGANKMVFHGS